MKSAAGTETSATLQQQHNNNTQCVAAPLAQTLTHAYLTFHTWPTTEMAITGIPLTIRPAAYMPFGHMTEHNTPLRPPTDNWTDGGINIDGTVWKLCTLHKYI